MLGWGPLANDAYLERLYVSVCLKVTASLSLLLPWPFVESWDVWEVSNKAMLTFSSAIGVLIFTFLKDEVERCISPSEPSRIECKGGYCWGQAELRRQCRLHLEQVSVLL